MSTLVCNVYIPEMVLSMDPGIWEFSGVFYTSSLSGHQADYSSNTNVVPSLHGTTRMSRSFLDSAILTQK